MQCALCQRHVNVMEHHSIVQEQIGMRGDFAQAYDGLTDMVATRADGHNNVVCYDCHQRAKRNAEGIAAANYKCCGGHS